MTKNVSREFKTQFYITSNARNWAFFLTRVNSNKIIFLVLQVLFLAILLGLSCLGQAQRSRNVFLRARQGRSRFGGRINNNKARTNTNALYSAPEPVEEVNEIPFEPVAIGGRNVAQTVSSSYSAPSQTVLTDEPLVIGSQRSNAQQVVEVRNVQPAVEQVVLVQQPQTVVRNLPNTYSVASVPQETVLIDPVQIGSNLIRTNNVYQKSEADAAILRSTLNTPGAPGYERSFGYSFESENGIQQQSEGELKTIGDAEVMTMRGSYSYPGDDGQVYVVDWYADETGYHASAPHLPKNVPIPFPEQAEAVEAQLRRAEEERALGITYDESNEVVRQVGNPVEIIQVRSPTNGYSSPLQLVEVRAPLAQYTK